VFSEIFLVQIYQNFGKYIPNFIFKAKKTSENAFRSLKLGAKMKIRGEKELWGVGKKNFIPPALNAVHSSIILKLKKCILKKKKKIIL
jgi:hypothetical protein